MNGYDENPFTDASTHDRAPLTGGSATPPAWLQEDVKSSSAVQAQAVSTDGESDPAIPKMILYSRVINLVLSVCMIVASLLSLLTTDNATTGVLACYVVVFSCLICCFETHMKLISKMIALNFGFMYSAKSRCAFMIFVGTILFSFSLFGKIVGCLMLGNAAFNIFVLIKYKGYDDAQRLAAQAEIQDFLASHSPAFASNLNNIKAGAASTAAAFVFNSPAVVSSALSGGTANSV